jgi:hypothetical protein
MLTANTSLESLLVIIQERIDAEKLYTNNVTGIFSFERLKHIQGKIAGLEAASQICADLIKELKTNAIPQQSGDTNAG